MPIVFFVPDGRIRIPKAVCERHHLTPDTEVTLYAVPSKGRLVLLPPNAQLPPPPHEDKNPVEDWKFTQIIDGDNKITIPALLRAAMGWGRQMSLAVRADALCVYICPKSPPTERI